MRTYRVCVAVAVAFVAVAARADVWRWIDDHGQVQYSDRWQPSISEAKSARDGGEVEAAEVKLPMTPSFEAFVRDRTGRHAANARRRRDWTPSTPPTSIPRRRQFLPMHILMHRRAGNDQPE